MIKTIIIELDQLEAYLNKKGYTFLCNYQDKFIFKYSEVKKTTDIIIKKTLKEIIKENFTQNFLSDIYNKYGLSKEDFKNECELFVLHWEETNANSKVQKWQKEKTFDVKLRFIKRMSNNQKWNSKTNHNIGVTEL